MITEIKGDITKVKCDYICQQNNCIAVKPHGLSLTIAREMGVCPYSRRTADGKKNLAIEEDRPPLGRILTEKSPFKDVHVICMFAQYSYGTPQSQYSYSRDETYKTREEAFKKCLYRINKRVKKDAKIAFPKYIGCGLASGDWNNYLSMIEEFAVDRDVIIVEYDK